MHVCFSAPSPEDQIGVTYDSKGRVDSTLLTAFLPSDDYDYYLCGPSEFMKSLYSGLTGTGVRPERIHYESFGPGTVLKPELPRKPSEDRSASPVHVNLLSPDRSRMVPRRWHSARACGRGWLAPPFGCRSGICGTCKTRIVRGAVDYLDEPLADRGEGEILLLLFGA